MLAYFRAKSELDDLPLIGFPFGDPGGAFEAIHPVSGRHVLVRDAPVHGHLCGSPDAVMFS